MGADAPAGGAGQVYQHHLRGGDIIGIGEQLFHQLRAALAHAHGAKGAVTGMAVRAQDHAAATAHGLPGVAVDDALVGGHVDAAVFFRGGQAEHMVVLVDGAANGAKAVVAIGHGIGQGEAFHAAGPGALDDAHIGDIVGDQLIEPDPQLGGVRRDVVGV